MYGGGETFMVGKALEQTQPETIASSQSSYGSLNLEIKDLLVETQITVYPHQNEP
jgi:hypothetical protein